MKFKFIDHSRTIVKISGPDKYNLLQGLITNDINKTNKQCIYTAMLTPVGKYLFDFFVYPVNDVLFIDINASQKDDFLKKIQMYKLRSQVDIIDASDKFQIVISDEPLEEWSFLDPRNGYLGYRSLISTDAVINNHGLEVYESLRISMAVPVADKELIQDKSIILECGLDELNALDWDKGCYIGQELMARTKHRGGINKRLFPVVFSGPTPEFMDPIISNDKEVGKVRSTHRSLGIAMIRLEALKDDNLKVNGHLLTIRQPHETAS